MRYFRLFSAAMMLAAPASTQHTPELIDVGLARVWDAPGLTRAQKRKFLYDNAARFLRIDPANTGIR